MAIILFFSSNDTPEKEKQEFDRELALGNSKYNANDLTGAVDAYKNATKLIPTDATAHRYLGDSYFYAKTYDAAESEYATAIKLGMNDADTLENYANSVEMQDRHTEAIASYIEVQKKFPTYCRAYIDLGIAEVNSGAFQQALQTFDEAPRCDELGLLIYSARASAYAGLHEWSKAVDNLNILVKSNPNDASLRDRLAEAYEGAGDTEAANSQRSAAAEIRWRAVSGVGSFLDWLFG